VWNNQDSSVKWKTALACNDGGLGDRNDTPLEKMKVGREEDGWFQIVVRSHGNQRLLVLQMCLDYLANEEKRGDDSDEVTMVLSFSELPNNPIALDAKTREKC